MAESASPPPFSDILYPYSQQTKAMKRCYHAIALLVGFQASSAFVQPVGVAPSSVSSAWHRCGGRKVTALNQVGLKKRNVLLLDDEEDEDTDLVPDRSGITIKPPTGDPAEEYEPPEDFVGLDKVYVTLCLDKPGSFEDVRVPLMLDHLEWARVSARLPEESREACIAFDRALTSEDSLTTVGNVIGVAASSAEAAAELLERDPYREAGLFASSEMYLWPQNDHPDLNNEFATAPCVYVGLDKDGMLEKRMENRPDHLEYLKGLGSVVGAGPLIPLAEGATPVGSAVFFSAEDQEQAEAVAANDPYNAAGVFGKCLVHGICELDVDGKHLARPSAFDPVRERMIQRGLVEDDDMPVDLTSYPPLL